MPELTLTSEEREILILKSAWESIRAMLNYEVCILNHHDPDSTIFFQSRTHQQYFNIILLDLIHTKLFIVGKDCIEALQSISECPMFNSNVTGLKRASNDFKNWLDQDIELEHNGETKNFWFPSINVEIALKIKRVEFITICGNISKHNISSLSRQAVVIQKIFARNSVTIELTQALLIMEEFYEQFHDDLFNYHSSTIAEFVNNIRWEIYEYLQPLFKQSERWYLHEAFKERVCGYDYPPNVNDPYVRELFFSLMNDVRSKPFMPKFVVTKYAKMRY